MERNTPRYPTVTKKRAQTSRVNPAPGQLSAWQRLFDRLLADPEGNKEPPIAPAAEEMRDGHRDPHST